MELQYILFLLLARQMGNAVGHLYCDTIFSFSKERGIHCLQSKNSQAPNSIVAILTVGHSRISTMERVKCENGPTDQVLETRHFVLSHGSLFVLHPLDERPSVRDGIMSYWKHGDVRLACTNPFCKDRCVVEQCQLVCTTTLLLLQKIHYPTHLSYMLENRSIIVSLTLTDLFNHLFMYMKCF